MPEHWSFLIDEDMPRSTARVLRAAGYQATDVRDIGLTGQADSQIFAHAQIIGATIVTADRDFADFREFPLGTHAGIVLTRTPNELPTSHLNSLCFRLCAALKEPNFAGHSS